MPHDFSDSTSVLEASLQEPATEGQAVIEFLFCAITFLFVLLGTLQLVLVLNAQIAVNYAAFSAARSAIVTNCDQEKARSAVRMALVPVFPKHGRASTPRGFHENYAAASVVDQDTGWWGLEGRPITSVTMQRGPRRSETVTFDDTMFGNRTPITVQVVHQYELVIPLVNAILFKALQLGRTGKLSGNNIDTLALAAAKTRRSASTFSGFRIPLVASYTMHTQSDCRGW